MRDGFVKRLHSALRFIPCHGDVPVRASHSSVVARLTSGAFYDAGYFSTYCGTVND